MHILFLGTGAADYEYALTCSCANCREMRALGGPNVRTNASALIDGALLVDCGPTVPARLAECCISPGAIADVIVTHSHSDHLDAGAIAALAGVSRPGDAALSIWANAAACDVICRDGAYERIGTRLMLHEIVSGECFHVGGLDVLALPARHGDAAECALNYVISDGEHSALYATDTAWPPPEAWAYLDDVQLDLAVVEATFGPLRPAQHPDIMTHHLNWAEATRLREELVRTHVLSSEAPVYATHMSQHHCPIHEKCCAQVAEGGLQLAYDGCEVDL